MSLLARLQQRAVELARTDGAQRAVLTYREAAAGRQAWRRLQRSDLDPATFGLITPDEAAHLNRLLGLQPERAARLGALSGGAAGLLAALLGGLLLPPLLGLTPMLAVVLLAAASGLLNGGYFGALYAARWAALPALRYKEALADGAVLITMQADQAGRVQRTLNGRQRPSYLLERPRR